MPFDWLAAIFGEKKIHLSFLNFSRKGNTLKSKQNKKSKNKNDITNSSITNIENNGTTVNYNIFLGQDGKLTPDSLEMLKPLVTQFEKKQVAFLSEETSELVDEIKIFEQDSMVKGQLKFFKYRLSPNDFRNLRIGLYLTSLRENGKASEAKKIWNSLSNYQLRDRRIVELASSGYFNSYFRPRFKQLMKKDAPTAQAAFDKEFENILSEMSFAIFVHNNLSIEDIVNKVTERAIKNIKYGVNADLISIHATGRMPVKRVISSIEELSVNFPVINIVSDKDDKDIIRVDIEYKKNSIKKELLEDDTI